MGKRGKDLLTPVAYIDTDGTIAPTTGQCKAGMDMSYKGIWGYATADRVAGQHPRGVVRGQPAR
jgi:hypothetical protein